MQHNVGMFARARTISSTAVEFGRRLLDEVRKDGLPNGAGALAFYSTLALFPAAIFLLSLLPYLPIPHLQQAIFDLLYEIMPANAAQLFTETVQTVSSERNSGLLSFGFLFLVWSSSSGVTALIEQLNRVYGVQEARPFWKARLVAVALMLIFICVVVLAFGLVIFGGVLQDWAADRLGWSPALRLFFSTFRWIVIVIALVLSFALVYRIAPNTRRPFKALRAGNLFGAFGLLVSSFGFKLYVASFGSYDATYGSLGAAIVLLMWLFIAAWVVLIGGEINEIVDRKAHDPASEGVARPAERPARGRAPTGRALGPLPPYAAADQRDGKISIVVWGAIAANVGIAAAKIVAASVTGSSALISEAIHSIADTGNGLLLVLGKRLSTRPADRIHPFGRGQEIYFWGLIVAVVLFGLGGGLSLYEGVQHIVNPHPIESALWSYVVLGCAFLFESISLGIAVVNMRRIARAQRISFFQAAHSSKNPEHFVVLFEDSAALLGVLVAVAGTYASHALGMPVIDGVASVIIGLILAATALLLAYECRSLLLGEAADPATLADIRAIVARDEAVERAGTPLTMHLGPDQVLLNLEVELAADLSAEQARESVARLERAIRERHRELTFVYIEVAKPL